MNHRYNITTKQPSDWKVWESPQPENFPLIHHQGTDYHLVPKESLDRIRTNRIDHLWLAAGFGLMTIAAGFALLVNILKPATQVITVEKPVIVTQEKVIPTNCLIFCK